MEKQSSRGVLYKGVLRKGVLSKSHFSAKTHIQFLFAIRDERRYSNKVNVLEISRALVSFIIQLCYHLVDKYNLFDYIKLHK